MGRFRRSRSRFWKPWANGSTPTATTIYGTERGQLGPDASCNYRGAATRSTSTQQLARPYAGGRVAQLLSSRKSSIAIGGLKPKVMSAQLLKTGEKVEFTQDEFDFRLTGLPMQAPDQPATVIEVECDGEPTVDHGSMRPLWPRYKVGISV